ncbi:cleavage stimulation factor subunit 1 [Angomonas deanei]|nr:cleavage stimulation factor subunit 1 [Angomonas deanei]|eukprot:EPY41879.1 cleavage stimulation factor subunit 1 [Angomonas deanei]
MRAEKRKRCEVLSDSLTHDLYESIIKQLHHDGFVVAASAVSDATGVIASPIEEDSERLLGAFSAGTKQLSLAETETSRFVENEVVEFYLNSSKVYLPTSLSYNWTVGRKQYKMKERFCSAALAGVVRDLSFSPDGSLVSCCGTNGLAVIFSIETLENTVTLDELKSTLSNEKLKGKSQNTNEISEISIARRFRDHSKSVEVMRFHPTNTMILSGGLDQRVCIHNFGEPDSKLVLELNDRFPIRDAAFHPSGEYLLLATDDITPRLVNLETRAVLTVSTPPSEEESTEESIHSAALNAVDFSSDGRTLATSSLDGSWVLFDGVSGKMIYRSTNAHSSVPVTSVKYSRSGNTLLTGGMDSVARLWDLRMLENRTGDRFYEVASFGEPGNCNHRSYKAVSPTTKVTL